MDPDNFCNLIEKQEPRLQGFFKAFENALNPKTRSQKTHENTKKAIVGFCYLLAGLGNKFVNNLKLEIGLYLVACGTSREGIETLSAMGLSACAKTVDQYRKEIVTNHPKEINKYFTIYVSYLEYLNILNTLIKKNLIIKCNLTKKRFIKLYKNYKKKDVFKLKN